MSYYVKHIITIEEESSREKLEELAKLLEDETGFAFKVFDDHIDDSNWIGGLTGIWDDSFRRVSESFGEYKFTVHCVAERGIIYNLYCYNGHMDEFILHQSEEWYEANKDGYEKSPGVRRGYFTDYGLGGVYPVLWGNETVPAGVDWTALPENNDGPIIYMDWLKWKEEKKAAEEYAEKLLKGVITKAEAYPINELWLTRDKNDNTLMLWKQKPTEIGGRWMVSCPPGQVFDPFLKLNQDAYTSVTFDNSPMRVMLTQYQ